jgi:DNA primase
MSEAEKIKILSNVLGTSYREGHSQLLFHCPSCEHHKKKLSINVERNLFKCWVCDYSGKNVFRIIKRFGTYTDKRDWSRLTQQVEIENFSEKLFGAPIQEEERLFLPKEFISLANKSLPPTATYPLNYLKSRGLTKEDIKRWKIGYCSSGEYEGRVVFPSFNLSGNLNYFVGRSYIGDWRRYINPSVRSDVVFNHLMLDFLKPIVIVEGVIDAIKAGINSAPLLGSTLSEASILFSEIVKNDTTVYLALDSDASRKTERLIKLFLKYDIELHVVDLQGTPYEDVGDMPKEEFERLKTEAEKLDAEKFLVNRIMKI